MVAAVDAAELFNGIGGADLINQAADGNHGGIPCVGAELQCVDSGAGGFELGLKGGGGHLLCRVVEALASDALTLTHW